MRWRCGGGGGHVRSGQLMRHWRSLAKAEELVERRLEQLAVQQLAVREDELPASSALSRQPLGNPGHNLAPGVIEHETVKLHQRLPIYHVHAGDVDGAFKWADVKLEGLVDLMCHLHLRVTE